MRNNKPKTNDKMVYFNWKKHYGGTGRAFAFAPGDMVMIKEGRLMNRLGGVMALKNTQPPMYVVAVKGSMAILRPNKLVKVEL